MSEQLTEEELSRLRKILQHEGLNKFLPYADQAAAELKLSSARRLVWRSSRQFFIAFVGIIVALATFWEKAVNFLKMVLLGGV